MTLNRHAPNCLALRKCRRSEMDVDDGECCCKRETVVFRVVAPSTSVRGFSEPANRPPKYAYCTAQFEQEPWPRDELRRSKYIYRRVRGYCAFVLAASYCVGLRASSGHNGCTGIFLFFTIWQPTRTPSSSPAAGGSASFGVNGPVISRTREKHATAWKDKRPDCWQKYSTGNRAFLVYVHALPLHFVCTDLRTSTKIKCTFFLFPWRFSYQPIVVRNAGFRCTRYATVLTLSGII